MKNKGFTLLECIFCVLFLSGSIVGIIIPIITIKNSYDKKYYESIIAINQYALFNIFTSDPINTRKNIINYFNCKELNDGSIEVVCNLEKNYKKKDKVEFIVFLTETESSYIMKILLKGELENYEEINNEYISKREVSK